MKKLARWLFCGCACTSLPSLAWNPPDTADLLASDKASPSSAAGFFVVERERGLPSLLAFAGPSKVASKDTLWLRLIWREGKIVEARYQQSQPFNPDAFMPLASQYGGGGTWHELAAPAPQSLEAKAYPGVVQQWQLEGYGGVAGWAGAGVHREIFFLVFRRDAITRLASSEAPLALRDDLGNCLDTLSQWMKVSCPRGWPGIPTLSTCYSPVDNPRRYVAKMPLRKQATEKGEPMWVVLWQEGEGLQEIMHAMQTLPRGEEAGYSDDLSRILAAEGRSFLTQIAHANPCVFNQPSWAMARMKFGQIPPVRYHAYLGDQGKGFDWLPALQHAAPNCSLSVDIAKGGAYRLRVYSR